MAARQCRRCRALFNYIHGDIICPKCKDQEEVDFKVVRKYLRQNPKSTIHQTVNETEVNVQLINKFLREGRLEITDDSPIGIDCQRCGVMIKSGQFCEDCQNEIKKELNGAANRGNELKKRSGDSEYSSKGAKMHYLNRDN
ncbi:MerR family transcriptional regulator [Vallitalea okinawensis]|uniref:MerR family transcriptional regulator n=1 Tax=Vallitalea okinawensis TaxID=2078660 RepID=UPI000CFB9680|nr:MerR family transcriptional regulator [Vallitalea okinawensis]